MVLTDYPSSQDHLEHCMLFFSRSYLILHCFLFDFYPEWCCLGHTEYCSLLLPDWCWIFGCSSPECLQYCLLFLPRMCWIISFLLAMFKTPLGYTVLHISEPRKVTKQRVWRATQPLQVVRVLEDLKRLRAWDITCRFRAKDTTPSASCRSKVSKEEALDDPPWKDEKGPLSVRPTLE